MVNMQFLPLLTYPAQSLLILKQNIVCLRSEVVFLQPSLTSSASSPFRVSHSPTFIMTFGVLFYLLWITFFPSTNPCGRALFALLFTIRFDSSVLRCILMPVSALLPSRQTNTLSVDLPPCSFSAGSANVKDGLTHVSLQHPLFNNRSIYAPRVASVHFLFEASLCMNTGRS